jgi:hypothetical protein
MVSSIEMGATVESNAARRHAQPDVGEQQGSHPATARPTGLLKCCTFIVCVLQLRYNLRLT